MVSVAVNGLSVAHKGSNGLAMATVPDVCKTPSPGGPVPVPYPNIARSASLAKGTKKVKTDGKMTAIKGCKFSRSNGDEAGTAGGVVSNSNMKEAEFILFSFDVKLEGKNACRLTDKMTCNKKNTVCLAGEIQAPVLQGLSNEDLQKVADQCNRKVNKNEGYSAKKRPSGKACTTLGTKKHKCCEDSINNYKANNTPPKGRGDGHLIEAEVPFDKAGNRLSANAESVAREKANSAYKAAKANGSLTDKTWANAYFGEGGAAFKADVLLKDDSGDYVKAFDFKFNCKDKGAIDKAQITKYQNNTGIKPEMLFSRGHMF
jgi:uncharacterized Zn-binding protein involved in type VI secretion